MQSATPGADGADPGDDWVIVGSIGKPFGTRGEVYVFADPDLDEAFEAGSTYRTSPSGMLTVARSQMHRSRLIVAFEGSNTREDAESLRGRTLLRSRGEVQLAEGTIWVADLKGRDVVDGDGTVVGVVETVRDGHAHDYLVIALPSGSSVTVPLVPEIVDTSAEVIVIDAPTGLLDPDAAW